MVKDSNSPSLSSKCSKSSIFIPEDHQNMVPSQPQKYWKIEDIPAFCITLERRLDRWKRFQSQPGVQSLGVKRFLGVDGKTLDIASEQRVTTLTKRNILTKSRRSHEELNSMGGVGCALSHIAVWQWMVDNNQPFCLIFEDDVVVPDDLKERANQLIATSLLKNTGQWDMWLLGGTWDDLTSIPTETKQSGLVRVGSFVLFHAYVMTLPMAKRLVQDAYPIHCHIDLWTSVYAYLNDLRIVGSPQLKLKQNPKTATDIQTEEDCALCNVPTDFTKTHRLITHLDWHVATAAKVGILFIAGYGVYRLIRQNLT
jgi:glycosyl transferase family 25